MPKKLKMKNKMYNIPTIYKKKYEKKKSSKISNSPIHQFTNLKYFKMSFKAFKMKNQGLKKF